MRLRDQSWDYLADAVGVRALACKQHLAVGKVDDLQLGLRPSGVGHELLLSVDELVELGEDALRLDRAAFDAGAVDGESLPQLHLVGLQEDGNLVQWHVERVSSRLIASASRACASESRDSPSRRRCGRVEQPISS